MQHTIRQFTLLVAGLLGVAVFSGNLSPQLAAADHAPRPNVVWIVSDDLSPDLGCYGASHISTPHLDGLAAEGVRFTRAFATCPVCSPSRTALITGVFQTTLGGHHHRTRIIPQLNGGVVPVTELFRAAGYFVCNMSRPDGSAPNAKTDYNFQHGDLFDGADWKGRAPGQPFFAQLQIKEPHRPFHSDSNPDRWQRLTIPPQYPDHPVTRKDWANYLASVEVMDSKVGQLLARLEREGLTDNTLVLFFGDHGQPHVWAKQWLYEPGLHVPLIVRWPGRLPAGQVDSRMVSLLDVAATSLAAAGLPRPDWMQGVDFLAPEFSGHSAIFAARDRCGEAVDRIRSVRTDRYKYIRNFEPDRPYLQMSGYKTLQYPVVTLLEVLRERNELTPAQARFLQPTRPVEELYDLEADPHELVNLASSPAHVEKLAELRSRLERWIEETGDQGQLPEGDAALIDSIEREKHQDFARAMTRRGLNPEATPEEYLRWWEEQLGLPVK